MNDLRKKMRAQFDTPLPKWGKILILVLAIAGILGVSGYMVYLEVVK